MSSTAHHPPGPTYAPFRVITRVRPPRGDSRGSCLQQVDHQTLEASLIEKNKLVRSNIRGQAPRSTIFLSKRPFKFDAAFFCSATTYDVYEQEVRPMVERVLTGSNCCVLAYGATGSGKTHTMTGAPGSAGGLGFLHMCAADLCDQIASMRGEGFPLSLSVTGCEIYQEELLDLAPAPGNCKLKRMSTTTLKRVPIPSGTPGELVAAVEALIARRAAGATNKNEHSSRSHAIYSILLEEEEEGGGPGYHPQCFGALALVDLAGAEYAAATEGREDVRRLEGGKNNLGLMSLKAAFRHIGSEAAAGSGGGGGGGGEGVNPPAPPFSWHRSKLTAALRPFFTDTSGRMLMLITASPDAVDAAQTSQTLEEGVVVAGRPLMEKVVTELQQQQQQQQAEPPPRILKAGSGLGGSGGGGGGGGGAGRSRIPTAPTLSYSSALPPPTSGGSSSKAAGSGGGGSSFRAPSGLRVPLRSSLSTNTLGGKR